jgi:hypothetical protein
VVGLGGAGTFEVKGAPAGGGAGNSISVGGDLGFGGVSVSSGGTGTFRSVLNAGPLPRVNVTGAHDALPGDLYIYPDSKYELAVAPGYRPTPGANRGNVTLISYTGTRNTGILGNSEFVSQPARAEWGVDYSLAYDDPGKAVKLNLDFVYGAGDVDFNRRIENADTQAILAAAKFNMGPSQATWAQGDFDNNNAVDLGDIQMMLATNLLDAGDYSALDPLPTEPDGTAILRYDSTTGSIRLDPDGLNINGFRVLSSASIFTGAAAQLPTSSFNTDLNGEIGTGFVSITSPLELGNVVGVPNSVDPFADFSFTYTVQGHRGIFTGDLAVVPLPGRNWNADTNGNWSVAANWTGGEPNAVGAAAGFLGAITAPRTVSIDGAKTVGSLTFDNANSYTLAGAGPLCSSTMVVRRRQSTSSTATTRFRRRWRLQPAPR